MLHSLVTLERPLPRESIPLHTRRILFAPKLKIRTNLRIRAIYPPHFHIDMNASYRMSLALISLQIPGGYTLTLCFKQSGIIVASSQALSNQCPSQSAVPCGLTPSRAGDTFRPTRTPRILTWEAL
jgi:hypothetical protein